MAGLKQLHDSFTKNLALWRQTHQIPPEANADVREFLTMKGKRLYERNLQMKVEHDYGEEGGFNLYHRGKLGDKLTLHSGTSMLHKTLEFYRGGKRVYKSKNTSLFEVTMIDSRKANDPDLLEKNYNCPACGYLSKMGDLIYNGCPFCHAYFEAGELYPKVMNYFYSRQFPSAESLKPKLKTIAGIITGIFFLIALASGEINIAMIIFGVVLFPWVIVLIIMLATPFLYMMNIDALIKALQSYKCYKIIKKSFAKNSKDFAYTYFINKMIALFRIIIYSDDPQNLPEYVGGPLNPKFADIVDVAYRHGIKILKHRETENTIEVKIVLRLSNIYDRGGRLSKRNERIVMEIYHDKNYELDPDFSIRRVNCHSCGAGFDARHQKNCPYCKSEYDAGKDDWIVRSIR